MRKVVSIIRQSTEGHEIAHKVGGAVHNAMPSVAKILVHVEPVDDFGKRSRNNLGE